MTVLCGHVHGRTVSYKPHTPLGGGFYTHPAHEPMCVKGVLGVHTWGDSREGKR